MNLAVADKSHSFEATWGPGLDVAMSVYDDSGGSPSLIQGPSAMTNVVGGTYRGKFTPAADKQYVVFKAVYTDGTFTTLHPDYSQSSETIVTAPAGADAVNVVKVGGFDLTATVEHETDLEIQTPQFDLEMQIDERIL